MQNLNDFIKNMDPKTLQQGIERASQFAKTPEGKTFVENIKKENPKDKDEIMKMMMKNPEIMKAIEKFLK